MLEVNHIYNIDCVEGMRMLPDNSIDLTVTSPPYDDLREYNGFSWDFEETARELHRVTKQGGVVVWVVNDKTDKGSETGTSFRQALFFKECGFNLHDTMIWFKPNCFNFGSNNCYKQSFEYMFIFSKGKPKAINLIKDIPNHGAGTIMKGARKHADGSRDAVPDFVAAEYKRRFNVWGVNVCSKTNGHPAVFPERLANDHILSWSNPGDVVLDPFSGSGTTAKMAYLNDRKYIGFEISKEYCELSRKRLAAAKAETKQIHAQDLGVLV
jgi:site-specific DNA-methyltransferase (adenine-specific)